MFNESGKTERIAIRMTPENKKILQELAKAENRSLSNWCESAILDKINLLKKEKQNGES